MEARAWGLLLLFVLLGGEETAAAADNNAFCPADDRLLSHFFLLSGDSCLASAPPQGGVLEGDESTLQKASNLVYKNSGDYVAVLFYASWCPFSKTCRPNFDAVSRLFPAIRHFAFEESVIRPSVLSKYRVYGFPTLFLVNATRRVYYHGSREVNSFITFYRNVTVTKHGGGGVLNSEQDNYKVPNWNTKTMRCQMAETMAIFLLGPGDQDRTTRCNSSRWSCSNCCKFDIALKLEKKQMTKVDEDFIDPSSIEELTGSLYSLQEMHKLYDVVS